MPIYQGGKSKIGKQIAEQISLLENRLNYTGDYVEPFCGMLGVGEHFAKQGRKVEANDINQDLILLLKAIKRGWTPPKTCSKKTYLEFKDKKRHSVLRGFYGFACAYSGIFYAGYRIKSGSRNFFETFRRGLLSMKPWLSKVHLTSHTYTDLEPKGCTIYCDPPYRQNNFGISYFENFDFQKFWDIVRKWSRNNLVVISEYSAPSDFVCIWEKPIKSSFHGTDKRTKRIEKLFIWKYS
jgi:DNA adenine methylase